MFRLDQVQQSRERVRTGVSWIALDQMYGPHSPYPLKAEIAILYDQWDAKHNAGLREHSRGLNRRQRNDQGKEGMFAFIEPGEYANRKCLLELPVLRNLSWTGPTFESRKELDAWLDAPIADAPEGEVGHDPRDGATKAELEKLYTLDAAGRWSIPEGTPTPECWWATEEMKDKLLEDYAFVRQIVGLRQILIEQVQEGEGALQEN